MHIFVSHIYEFVELYGDISLFTQEGLEKHNNNTTINYQRSTNKGSSYLEQLLQKHNRLDLYKC
jgi:hypothetical protein